MSTRGYIGRTDADDPNTVHLRYIHSDANPGYLLPVPQLGKFPAINRQGVHVSDQDNSIPDINPQHLTKLLVQAEAHGQQLGWNHQPVLLAISNEPVPYTSTKWRLAARSLPIPVGDWNSHPDGPLRVLEDVVATGRTPEFQAQAVLARHNDPYTRIVAWAFVYLITSTDNQEARVVDAVDMDGRRYRVSRTRPTTGVVTDVDTDGTTYLVSPTHELLNEIIGRLFGFIEVDPPTHAADGKSTIAGAGTDDIPGKV